MMAFNKISIFLSLIVTLAINGCNNKPSTLVEYRPWFGDPSNGFTKTKSVHDLNFKVQYLPSELLAFNDIDPNSFESSEFDSLTSYYDHSSYFLLQFYPSRNSIDTRSVDLINGVSLDFEDYRHKLDELNYHLDNNIQLISGSDTIMPSIYHFERGYDASPIQRAIIAFPKSSNDLDHITFIYRDDLFNSGIHKYQFDIHELYVPQLPSTF